MPSISFLAPLDQPSGRHRLLPELRACLQSPHFSHLRLAVAFAKTGPLLRLSQPVDTWRASGKTIEAMFGIDHRGTSIQALELAMLMFDRIYVVHTSSATLVALHGSVEED